MSTKLRLLIRTHYIDPRIDFLYEKWSGVLPGRVGLLLDETNQTIDTNYQKVSFNLNKLSEDGLPAKPEGKAAWYCGDYTMAAVASTMEDDEFCYVVENDVVPSVQDPAAWKAKLEEMSKHELVVANYKTRGRRWKWRQNLEKIYGNEDIYGALIIFLGFSKATAEFMTKRRVEISNSGVDQWPHCEAFVGTEAALAGLDVGDVFNYFPQLSETFSTSRPYMFFDVANHDMGNTMYHPAVDRQKYLVKMRTMIANKVPGPMLGQYLDALGPLDEAERKTLDSFSKRRRGVAGLADLLE
ncbi:hypothetical protein [Halodurantibacterium flavum]|uniref:Glycosyltransferase family 25 protein n=1 Tax=Halodurantibacterium flavum TaxID=1382802 RepID=A0ABW4SB57_9RHOB